MARANVAEVVTAYEHGCIGVAAEPGYSLPDVGVPSVDPDDVGLGALGAALGGLLVYLLGGGPLAGA